MDKPSQSAWTKTTQSGETKYQNPGRQVCLSVWGCCFVFPDYAVLSLWLVMFCLFGIWCLIYEDCDVFSLWIALMSADWDILSTRILMFCLTGLCCFCPCGKWSFVHPDCYILSIRISCYTNQNVRERSNITTWTDTTSQSTQEKPITIRMHKNIKIRLDKSSQVRETTQHNPERKNILIVLLIDICSKNMLDCRS
jgi:hypothetical protein